MSRLVLFASVLCACKSEPDMYAIQPGGGGTGTSFLQDAAVGYDATTAITGRVCVLSDPRAPTTCASTGAESLTVTLGDKTATPAADGTFTIDRPTATPTVWRVSGTGVQAGAMRYGTSTTIPVISDLVYGDMIAGMSAVVTTETGGVIVQLRHGGTALTGAVAAATPPPDSAVYYDGPSTTAWSFDATGAYGVVWISAIAPGTASLAVNTGTVTGTVAAIPVFTNTLTYELAEIP